MAVTVPRIISCDEWGAKPAGPHKVFPFKANGIVIHHTTSDNVSTAKLDRMSESERFKRACAWAQGCQVDHMNRGWKDTGQHFTVTRDGLILEGRRGSIDCVDSGAETVQGAHTFGGPKEQKPGHIKYWNDGYIGIENEGLYTAEDPPDALWDSLILLCAYICQQYGMQIPRILGHRDFNTTECPGKQLYLQLGSLRGNVATAMRGTISW